MRYGLSTGVVKVNDKAEKHPCFVCGKPSKADVSEVAKLNTPFTCEHHVFTPSNWHLDNFNK